MNVNKLGAIFSEKFAELSPKAQTPQSVFIDYQKYS
jgi:hypothetical protein